MVAVLVQRRVSECLIGCMHLSRAEGRSLARSFYSEHNMLLPLLFSGTLLHLQRGLRRARAQGWSNKVAPCTPHYAFSIANYVAESGVCRWQAERLPLKNWPGCAFFNLGAATGPTGYCAFKSAFNALLRLFCLHSLLKYETSTLSMNKILTEEILFPIFINVCMKKCFM